MKKDILNKVIKMFQEELEDDAIVITGNSNIMDDLEMSSFEIYSIIERLEEEFNLEITDELMRNIIYIKDIVDIICKLSGDNEWWKQ